MDFQLLADRVEAIPIIAQWYFDEWGHMVVGNSFEKSCERIRGKLNRDKPPLHMLAKEGEKVLGVAQFKLREMEIYPEREHWLGGVFVAPEARGGGIASMLSLRIAEIAQTLGATKLFLQTERLDGGLYARLGWLPLERVRYHGVEVLVMEKELGK